MKYEIKYREIRCGQLVIEAEDLEQAKDKIDDLYANGFDLCDENEHSYISEDFDIESTKEISSLEKNG